MKSLLLLLLSTAASTAFAYSLPTISGPSSATSCSTQTVSFGGNGPFSLYVFSGTKILEIIPNLSGPQYQWRVIEPAGTSVYLGIVDKNNLEQSIPPFTIQPSNNGISTVPQKTLPSPGTCLSGDVGTTLASDSTCTSLTADGSTLYVGSSTMTCCDSIPAGTFVCQTPPSPPDCTNNGGNVPQQTLPGVGQCNSGDTGTTLTSTSTCDSLTSDGSSIYVGSSVTVCCNSIPSGTFVCNTPAPIPQVDCDALGGTVPQQTLAGGQCNAGDSGATLASDSTCASLTTGGSTIYVDSSIDVCCADIPAGTFVCTTPAPAPTCDLVPTNAAATTSCLASENSVTLTAATTCDFLNSFRGTTTPDYYTVSGSDICCDSIPVDTIICVPIASTSTCPTTTSPPTTTATQTSTSTSTATSGPSNGSSGYLGCYVDSIDARVLPNQMGMAQVTIELCMSACASAGYEYAGLEWSQECWCGNTVPATLATDGRCSMTCAGNSQEICGGGNGISVYTTGSGPTVLQSYNSWSYTGCYEDSVAARTMPTTVTTIGANAMTVEKCLDACNALGHSYAGLEYSQECYCADALPPTQATDGRCDMVCKGNELEYCGGGNGLTVYTYTYNPPYYSRRAF